MRIRSSLNAPLKKGVLYNMKVLKLGSVGPSVELLQLALGRAGARSLAPDGIFGSATKAALRAFQSDNGLAADGVAGPATHRALMPYYTGFASHRIHRGDTLFALSQLYNVPLSAILTANPGIAPEKLAVGSSVVIPLPFDIVPTNISFTSALVSYCVRGIAARYPFVKTGQIGKSVMGRPLWYLSIGEGEKSVFYNAAHHANEWITVPLLLSFAEKLARAYAEGGKIFGRSAKEIYKSAAIYIAPCVDPDGVDLVTGELTCGEFYNGAVRIAQSYPNIPFPSGWKANIRGTDLNLQYPAGWEQARENKFALGVVGPAPADYVGSSPLSAPESRAMYDFTLARSPQLTLAYHTQGEVIYWRYLDLLPPRSREIAETFSAVSGYAVEETPFASGFAGYKDWFIQNFDRPGYTIEAGRGINPLPTGQFDEIFEDNLGILTLAPLLI